MLTQFRFENFKSWRDTGEIRMAPLTGIFGTNSSGKTAILQFLLMLKQTAESNEQFILYLGNERTYTNLGTSFDILNRHIFPQNINYSLSWQPVLPYFKPIHIPTRYSLSGSTLFADKTIPYTMPMPEIYQSGLTFSSVINLFSINSIRLETFDYQFKYLTDNDCRIGIRLSESSQSVDFYEGFREGLLFEGLEFYSNIELMENPTKNHQFPNNFNSIDFSTRFPLNLVLSFEEQLEKTYYLGPLREYPQRSYTWSGEYPRSVGKKGEFIASALLASRNKKLNVEQSVAYWLKKLGLIHDFKIRAIAENRSDYEIKVRRFPDSPEVLITDVGFGVSQILPVLVLCYYVPEGSTIIFEQPEIHLHPSVQAGLADVFIDVIKTRNVQIILESHSEHLLRRLQRRIAEEHNHMTAEDAALYFCSIDDTGTSKLTSLELDTYGNINNWPQGFFGDEMGDLVAMTEAAMRRQAARS